METYFANRRNIITLAIIIILLLAIPLGLKLLQNQQILKSRAGGGVPIAFQGPNVDTLNGKQIFRLDDQGQPTVGLTLTSPFGAGSSGGSNQSQLPLIMGSPSSTSGSSSLVCQVGSDVVSGPAPLKVNFSYGASGFQSGEDYVTNVQWDFNGDGVWDTPLDLNGQHISYTYSQPGSYTVKMHLQSLQGANSGVCTNNITVNSSSLNPVSSPTPVSSGNVSNSPITCTDTQRNIPSGYPINLVSKDLAIQADDFYLKLGDGTYSATVPGVQLTDSREDGPGGTSISFTVTWPNSSARLIGIIAAENQTWGWGYTVTPVNGAPGGRGVGYNNPNLVSGNTCSAYTNPGDLSITTSTPSQFEIHFKNLRMQPFF